MQAILDANEALVWLQLNQHNTLDQLAELASSGKSYKDLMYNYRETRATELHNQVNQLIDEQVGLNTTIAQLRDELAKAKDSISELKAMVSSLEAERNELKRNWQAADDLLDKVGSIITAAIGCSGSGVLYDAELLVKELAKAKDNPDADCTDYAHPAWWRGHDHTVSVLCQKINDIIDGRDGIHGVASEPWQSTRHKILELKQRAERAESGIATALRCLELSGDVSLSNDMPLVDELICGIDNLTKNRDELKAKLEQPRMFMRDGQLWEVVMGDDKTIDESCKTFFHDNGKWMPRSELHTPLMKDDLYRRPLTPDELRSWLPEQQSQSPQARCTCGGGIAIFTADLDKCESCGKQYPGGHVVVEKQSKSNQPIEPQPQGEVLFEGVRYIDKSGWNTDRLLLVEPNGVRSIPVHVTIRKAGE